jgi:membrane fusion protein, multidrug efflux system
VTARVAESTRAVIVRGDFPNPERRLRPGMLMEVTLSQAERTALLVPEISIVQVGTDSFVFRLKPDGTVERVEVTVGARREGQAEIVKGASAGDRVVVDGTGKVREGAKVTEARAVRGDEQAAGAARGGARAVSRARRLPRARTTR